MTEENVTEENKVVVIYKPGLQVDSRVFMNVVEVNLTDDHGWVHIIEKGELTSINKDSIVDIIVTRK